MIYMDNAATTAVRKEVAEAMLPYLLGDYGNPSGVYRLSEKAKNVVEESRDIIADIINADRNEIFFTSGGTEGDNWAVKAESLKRKQGHIIVSSIEHHAVTESALWLKNYGIDVTFAPVDEQGIVKLEQLEKMIRNDTFLVSVMLANNEIGTIQPIENVCEIAHEYGAKVHSEAVAAFGHIDIDVHKLGVSMLSVSAHKICGPKGVGFLYTDRELEPLIYGGGQEKNMRSGTENVAGIIGLATAADIAVNTLHYRMEKEWNIQRYMAERIVNEIPYTSINGNMTGRVSGNINICFKGISAGELVLLLDKQGICVSSGSACHGNHGGPSHVLKAIGKTDEESLASIRLTFNHTLNQNQADYCIDCIKKNVAALRKIKND